MARFCDDSPLLFGSFLPKLPIEITEHLGRSPVVRKNAKAAGERFPS